MIASLSLLSSLVAVTAFFSQESSKPLYLNPNLTPERRAADVFSKMSLEEKVLQMQSSAPAIPRLNIPAFDWWNEALHGCRPGTSYGVPTGYRNCGHVGYGTDAQYCRHHID